jgi:CheY-like chemotaxis protein
MIEEKIKSRSASIVLVDPSGAVRQLLVQVLKNLGFEKAQAVSTVADAHALLEAEQVDWIIASLVTTDEINAFHTLRLAVNFSEVRGLKVSLLLDERDSACLLKAFELGMLSYHYKPFTKNSLEKDLAELLAVFEENAWNSTKTSAHYLRKHLLSLGQHLERTELERRLQNVFPCQPDLLYHFADALILEKRVDDARQLLKQISVIDSKSKDKISALETKIKEIGQTVVGGNFDGSGQANMLGLRNVVLIEPDDAARSSLEACFRELGAQKITCVADGDEAWSYVNEHEVDFIVSEWRIPALKTPLLLQRIRGTGKVMPFVVISSLVRASDMPLIREMGVTHVIEKPADRESIFKAIIWTVQQDRLPTDANSIEIKVRNLLLHKKVAEAQTLLQRYLDDPKIAQSRKLSLKAEFAFAREEYENCRDLAIEALKINPDSMSTFNTLGKAFLLLRGFDSALKCFEKAQSLSPGNIERLCLIAETHAELGDQEAASQSISKARDLDPQSPVVAEGAAKVAITSGSSNKAKDLLSGMESIDSVLSYMNNKAVAHARCGEREDSIQLYENILNAVPDHLIEIKDIVIYNLALGRIRNENFKDALVDLEKITAAQTSRIYPKAKSLHNRLKRSLEAGQTFRLMHSESTISRTTSNGEELKTDAVTLFTAMLELPPGEHCCYRLYVAQGEEPQIVKDMLKSPARFTRRDSIQRGDKAS